MTRNGAIERGGLGLHANIAATHGAMADEFTGNELRRIDGNRKAQPLRRQDGGRVYADDFAGSIHQRTAGVARI